MKQLLKILMENDNSFSGTERDKLQMQYPELFPKLEAIFFEYDPIGINFGSNPDEYAMEVEGVLKRLPYANSQDDVHTIVYETFCSCFDMQLAGERNSLCYRRIAKKTWEAWCREWDHNDNN